MKSLALIVSGLMLVACGGGGGGGGDVSRLLVTAQPCPVPPSASAGGSLSGSSGVVLNALSCTPIAGVKVTADVLGETTTGTDGSFRFNGASPATQYVITLTSPTTVTRSTFSMLDGVPRVFSLIPNDFSLSAFQEIARPSRFGLLRWTQAPTLIVQVQVIDMSTGMLDTNTPVDLRNGGVSDRSYMATQIMMPDDLVADVVGRLSAVLPQLTAYPAFKEVRIETAVPGSRVGGFERDGTIVVVWVTNIVNQGAAGMGLSSGYLTSMIPAIRAGTVFIDYNYSGIPNVLIHEFGHSLGYQHTDLTASFMNRSNSPLPTDFDLQAAKIAYDRSPGNKWPDIDPSP